MAWVNYEKEVENKIEIDRDTKLAEKIYNEKKKSIDSCDKQLLELENKLSSEQKRLAEAVSEFHF